MAVRRCMIVTPPGGVPALDAAGRPLPDSNLVAVGDKVWRSVGMFSMSVESLILDLTGPIPGVGKNPAVPAPIPNLPQGFEVASVEVGNVLGPMSGEILPDATRAVRKALGLIR